MTEQQDSGDKDIKQQTISKFNWEKTFPIALMVTVIVQVIGAVWVIATMNKDIQVTSMQARENQESIIVFQRQINQERNQIYEQIQGLRESVYRLKEVIIELKTEVKNKK